MALYSYFFFTRTVQINSANENLNTGIGHDGGISIFRPYIHKTLVECTNSNTFGACKSL